MKKIIFLSSLFLIYSCVTVKKHNEKLEIPISAENLKKDVDFTKHKLEQLHPKLYWYISEDQLNYQFDSLKTTIKNPLKPNEFFEKLASVVAKIKRRTFTLISL